MTEQHWQRAAPPRGQVGWVVAAMAAVLGVALLVQVDGDEDDGQALEVETEESPAATPSPTPPPEPSPEPADDPPVAEAGGTWRQLEEPQGHTRRGTPLVWTQGQGILWGGEIDAQGDGLRRRTFLDTGVAVHPDGRTVELPPGPLTGRTGHVAALAGEEVVVWGGVGSTAYRDDGAAFDPASGQWRALADSPLSPRAYAQAAWTGEELVVVGGSDIGGPLLDGAAYDPAADRWREIADLPRPLPSLGGMYVSDLAVWTGGHVVVGPSPPGPTHQPLLAYDPDADAWSDVPMPDVGGRQPWPLGLVAGAERLYAVGHGSGRAPRVWSLDAASDLADLAPDDEPWEALPEPPSTGAWPESWRSDALAGWTPHGLAVVAGGEHALLLDPDLGKWMVLPPMPVGELHDAQLAWTGEGLLVWGPTPHGGPNTSADPVLWEPPGG